MAAAAGGGGGELSRQVNQRLPELNLGARELSQNPKFANLLLLLADHMDQTGLSLTVKRDLEKARGELRRQRREWLRAELLQRALDEMLTDVHVKRWESLGPEDRQFFETLEQCQTLGRCCRRLDTRETGEGDARPPLLGLQRQNLQDCSPKLGRYRP
ncbi:HAUS augmin-like complex subunit 4 [Scyliorhinus torazame]|uniref:HAUS augmin-like complex subunit 4 n=1 Tax=Scyliorhinus torazame TaxID=75743 RepID=UPI003B5A205F